MSDRAGSETFQRSIDPLQSREGETMSSELLFCSLLVVAVHFVKWFVLIEDD